MESSFTQNATEFAEVVALDISIDYSNDPFYAETWFWVIIALFFLIVLIALVRGRKRVCETINTESSRSDLPEKSIESDPLS